MSNASQLADLRRLIDAEGPFVTVAIPTPSELDDAQHRFEIEWRNARREIETTQWHADDLSALDTLVATLPHNGGESFVVMRAADGTTIAEFLDEPIREIVVVESVLPRLALIIEARQRALSHLVVEADRAGADLRAFDGGRVSETDQVEGDTEHIHRGAPGGWSQRRFQQRAENTWERNADEVAAQIVEVSRHHEPEMIFIAGDVRAQNMVLESLPERERDMTSLIAAGSPEGIADEVARMLSDHAARGVRDLVERLEQRVGTGTASTDVADILACLAEGRVEHLLVHDDGSEDPVTTESHGATPAGARVVDAAIAAAIRTDADVTIVPRVAALDGPIAALYRW